MKNKHFEKKFLGMILSTVLLFSLFPFVSSADMVASDVTLYIPQFVRNNVLNGTVEINVSIADAFANQNWTRAVVHIVSAGATANTTLFALNNSPDNRNQSRNNHSLILITTPVEDGNDYTLYVQLWNGSNKLNVTATVTINNSIPVVASSIFPTVTNTNGTLNFTGTINNTDTTQVFLNFSGTNPGSKGYVMTCSGDICSYSLSRVSEQTYLYTITASDGNDLTTSALQTLRVDIPSNAGTVVALKNLEEKNIEIKEDGTLAIAGNGNSPSDLFAKFINWFKSLFN